jgi:transcriptional regulator with XRE-family HTH domain
MRKVTKIKESAVFETTGKRIALHRTHKGISQDELSQKLSVSREMLSMIEKDKRTPNIDDLKIIADVLEVTTDYLLCRSNIIPERIEDAEIHDTFGLSANAIMKLRRDYTWYKNKTEQKFRILKIRLLNYLIENDKLLYDMIKYLRPPTISSVVVDCHKYTLEELQNPDCRAYHHFSHWSSPMDISSVFLSEILRELSKLKEYSIKFDDENELMNFLNEYEYKQAKDGE